MLCFNVGLFFLQLLQAIRTVTKANIVGADVNELAPMLDQSGVSTATACKVLRELLLALERGASRPLSAPGPQPLMQRDATALWKIALAVSVLVNLLLIYWLLFLPR